MDKPRRFTGRQITTMVVALALAVVAAPVGALAATGSLINIADPTNPAQVAHVDATGHLEVGDGSGALTVDGVTRPQAPAAPWSISKALSYQTTLYPSGVVAGPTASTIDISSVSITVSGTGFESYSLDAVQEPANATSCGNVPPGAPALWRVASVSAGVPAYASFPAPLQVRPAAGAKVCLWAVEESTSRTSDVAMVNLSGYYGA